MSTPPPDGQDELTRSGEYTWGAGSFYEFRLLAYCIDRVVRKIDPNYFDFETESSGEFEYAKNKSVFVLCSGCTAFTYKDHPYIWTSDSKASCHTIKSNGPLAPLIKMIDNYIRSKNPLRNKNLLIYQSNGHFECLFNENPGITFDQCIVEPGIKEEVYDNTILQLKTMDMNNGIILHGEPGTGKSRLCQAVITEAIREGFTACCVTTSLHYGLFGRFVAKYLAPCVVVFEDIDSFANSRKEGVNPELADFLQLMSGISQQDGKTIFIATTNHLDLIDKAVSNRPMRFNRKLLIGVPSNDGVDQLIDLYFGNNTVSPALKIECHGCKFTGSHIKEIFRTASLESQKNHKPPVENFEYALAIVKKNFSTPSVVVGFGQKS